MPNPLFSQENSSNWRMWHWCFSLGKWHWFLAISKFSLGWKINDKIWFYRKNVVCTIKFVPDVSLVNHVEIQFFCKIFVKLCNFFSKKLCIYFGFTKKKIEIRTQQQRKDEKTTTATFLQIIIKIIYLFGYWTSWTTSKIRYFTLSWFSCEINITWKRS